jgi:hypothetical protein
MKKNENFWKLLERLDEQAGQYSMPLSEANRYFDAVAKKTNDLLDKHENELHATIAKVKKALKNFGKKRNEGENRGNNK